MTCGVDEVDCMPQRVDRSSKNGEAKRIGRENELWELSHGDNGTVREPLEFLRDQTGAGEVAGVEVASGQERTSEWRRQ